MVDIENSRQQSTVEILPSTLVVLPVYNEEKVLRDSVNTLRSFLKKHNQCQWKIVIADNNSNDKTGEIGIAIASEFVDVDYLHIPRKGRGIALRTAWEQTDCDFVSYMDIDLSTDLNSLIHAVDLLMGGEEIVVGNRLTKGSNTTRSLKREFISRAYNVVIRVSLGTHFTDAHCGFKTARSDVAKKILPYIEDNEWFFDTEFLFYGEKLGHKIVEIPITWVEDPDTKAKIFKDAYDDLRGLYRLRFHNNMKTNGEKT